MESTDGRSPSVLAFYYFVRKIVGEAAAGRKVS